MNDEILRNNIKVFRAKNDLTQEQLADLVHVTRTTINFVERGKWVPSADSDENLAFDDRNGPAGDPDPVAVVS